ncbi:MAG TPA: sodium:solute symporter [Chthoniobacterales bacterium]
MADFGHTPFALTVDAIVLCLYFFGIVGIGLWAGRRNRTLTDFALGGRSIPWWAVLASIIAAETSAVTFLGTPAEGFKTRSFVYGQLAIGTVLARIIIAFTFIRPYYRYGVQSIYEFLEIRFGPLTKNLASGIFLLTRILGIGVRLYLGGAIIKVVWEYLFPGAPIDIWIYFWGIVFVTVLTTIYTAIGGIKAVVWTDMIQATLMISSVLLAIGLILTHIPGGLSTVQEQLGGIPPFFQTGINHPDSFWAAVKSILEEPYTLAAALVASTFSTMATHGADQDMVQRMLTARDFTRSRLSLILSGLADIPIAISFLSVGILLWVYYNVNSSLTVPPAENEIFAHYIVTQMPIGVRGIIVAGIFATMMGSTSAALNALATSFTKDFYLPYFARNKAPESAIWAARLATSVFGGLMILVATATANSVLHDSKLTILPIALGIIGYTYGALLGVFLVGMLTRTRGNDRTNIVAMLVSIALVLLVGRVEIPWFDVGGLLQHGTWELTVVNLGSWLPPGFPHVAFSWWVFIGCVVCFLVSSVFRTPPGQLERAKQQLQRMDEAKIG